MLTTLDTIALQQIAMTLLFIFEHETELNKIKNSDTYNDEEETEFNYQLDRITANTEQLKRYVSSYNAISTIKPLAAPQSTTKPIVLRYTNMFGYSESHNFTSDSELIKFVESKIRIYRSVPGMYPSLSYSANFGRGKFSLKFVTSR